MLSGQMRNRHAFPKEVCPLESQRKRTPVHLSVSMRSRAQLLQSDPSLCLQKCPCVPLIDLNTQRWGHSQHANAGHRCVCLVPFDLYCVWSGPPSPLSLSSPTCGGVMASSGGLIWPGGMLCLILFEVFLNDCYLFVNPSVRTN